jgi:hypothetical protein
MGQPARFPIHTTVAITTGEDEVPYTVERKFKVGL